MSLLNDQRPETLRDLPPTLLQSHDLARKSVIEIEDANYGLAKASLEGAIELCMLPNSNPEGSFTGRQFLAAVLEHGLLTLVKIGTKKPHKTLVETREVEVLKDLHSISPVLKSFYLNEDFRRGKGPGRRQTFYPFGKGVLTSAGCRVELLTRDMALQSDFETYFK